MNDQQIITISKQLHAYLTEFNGNPEDGIKELIKDNLRVFNQSATMIRCSRIDLLEGLDTELDKLLNTVS